MRNAYESKEEYSSDGKRIVRRERTVGAVVIIGLVVFIIALTGNIEKIPAAIWALFK